MKVPLFPWPLYINAVVKEIGVHEHVIYIRRTRRIKFWYNQNISNWKSWHYRWVICYQLGNILFCFRDIYIIKMYINHKDVQIRKGINSKWMYSIKNIGILPSKKLIIMVKKVLSKSWSLEKPSVCVHYLMFLRTFKVMWKFWKNIFV